MKKVTLIIFITLSMVIFTGQTRIQPYTEMEVMKAEATTFSDASEDAETFSTADALEPYIQMAPPSVQVYYYTKKYCKEYNVPETIAFQVAKLETAYKGPDRHDYNPNQTSSGNARGTYQLLVSTAKDMYELLGLGPRSDITSERLLNDVELNVRLGVRYLRWVNDNVSKNWTVTCGFYNSGYAIINGYAITATRYM